MASILLSRVSGVSVTMSFCRIAVAEKLRITFKHTKKTRHQLA